MSALVNWLLALATAVLLILAFPRFSIAALAPVALAPLLIAVARETRARRRFLLGYLCGIVYWFGVCYWIQFVLAYHGGLGEPAGWAVFLLFCLAKAVHMGVFAWLAGYLMRLSWAIPAVAALWVAIEYTHQHLGFAWLPLGNAGVDMGIPMRLAPLAGVFGVSFVFALMGAALACALLRRPRMQLLWLAVLPALLLLPPLPGIRRGAVSAVAVQPDLPEDGDWSRAGMDKMQQKLLSLSMQGALGLGESPADLMVWPELPGPFYYYDDERFRDYVTDLARIARMPVLLSVVAFTPQKQPLNAALLVDAQGKPVERYDKIRLVPFGEFVPWPFGFAHNISSEISDFVSGSRIVTPRVGEHRIGTFICYESVFPGLVRSFAGQGAEVLFNLSNDGWFGGSAAREQHLNIVRLRAAENRRWIVRATNDGITAVLDPAGRILRILPEHVESVARMRFNYIRETTVYTRFGDWFVILCAGTAVVGLALGRRKPAAGS